jgi:hypothetical protein
MAVDSGRHGGQRYFRIGGSGLRLGWREHNRGDRIHERCRILALDGGRDIIGHGRSSGSECVGLGGGVRNRSSFIRGGCGLVAVDRGRHRIGKRIRHGRGVVVMVWGVDHHGDRFTNGSVRMGLVRFEYGYSHGQHERSGGLELGGIKHDCGHIADDWRSGLDLDGHRGTSAVQYGLWAVSRVFGSTIQTVRIQPRQIDQRRAQASHRRRTIPSYRRGKNTPD